MNPVSSSHFNFTTPEPTGVVVVICPDEPSLLGFVSLVAPVILSGNCAVVLVSTTKPLPALTFSEIIATSDLPAGVINFLAGDRAELAPHIASHMDVNAIDITGVPEDMRADVEVQSAENVKRVVRANGDDVFSAVAQSPYLVTALMEFKTVWHPKGA